MIITYITGDLLESPHRLILHGCNAQGVMGSGVAKAIRAKYPIAYKTYRKKYEDDGLVLGEVIYAPIYAAWPAANPFDNSWIANGISQEYYGRTGGPFVDYKAINSIMTNVNSFAHDYGIDEVAMPLIGAGLGGGSWKIISNEIEKCFTMVQPIVYTLDGIIPSN